MPYIMLVFFLFGLFPLTALGNGAVFHPHAPKGTPRPLKQSELYLEREKVAITKDLVVAKFWIANPSDHEIRVTMGFPIYTTSDDHFDLPEGLSGDEIRERLRVIPSNFKITIEGQQVNKELHVSRDGPYLFVFTWEMAFPAHEIVGYEVTYPAVFGTAEGDGGFDSYFLKYITHTGSYWSRPIGSAWFEVCDYNIVDTYKYKPPNVWVEHGRLEREVTAHVSPKPDRIDTKRNCLIWSRSNWVPKIGEDDISVSYSESYNALSFECFGADVCNVLLTGPSLVSEWIILNEHKRRNFCPKMVSGLDLETKQWNDVDLEQYTAKVFDLLYGAGFNTFSVEGPAHLTFYFELWTLAFLRNFIFARHGHKFKNQFYASCFEGVNSVEDWSSNEKTNLSFIKRHEKTAKKRAQKAWKEIFTELPEVP